MSKLMRSRKNRGRCPCPGKDHSNCEVTQEIRYSGTRNMDKRDIKNTIKEETMADELA